jgi:hypothetical protein
MSEIRFNTPLLKRLNTPDAKSVAPGKLLDHLEDQSVRPIHERKTRLLPKGRVEQFLSQHEGGVPGLVASAKFLRENEDISWDDYAKLKAEIRADQAGRKAEPAPAAPRKAFDGTTAQ